MSEDIQKHKRLVAKLHAVFETENISCDDALEATIELLGLVLANTFDNQEEINEEMLEINDDIALFISENWDLIQSSRAQFESSRIN